MIDNMLVVHARNPFRGPRRLEVAMSMPLASRAALG
jgi:hypothetical protein